MTDNALSRLSELVETAPNALMRAEALAKFGVCLAQLGRISEASDTLRKLRLECSGGGFARAGIQCIILEGVIGYYDNREPNSLDRLVRANALARSLRVRDIEAESAVWLAHLAFNFERYDLLGSAISAGFDGFDLLDDSLRARVCLIVADGYQFLGLVSLSSTWYGFSRIFARRTNDRAVLVAIEFNRLMIGLGRIRVESFMPVLKAESMHVDWLGELSSIRRLHQGFGANALNELFLLCDTQIAEAAGDFEKARQALLEIQRTDAASRCGMSVELLSLEIEWCRIKACAVGISVLPDLPNLDAIRLMKFDEQVVALRFIEDIYAYSGIEIDRLRIDAMRQRAIEKCLDIDKAALSALSVSQDYLNSTKRRVRGLSSEAEFN